uniref:Uncharacterized protein LOC102805945 n=1 Tax=Saccoglossus kowalevskii TaxID=10224 RepID=A0ABM0MMJ5_SACKO|nr:PREDICTED: uncharacterized protein LOC102805945 [Saccoglossus kowalevskii]
MASKFCIYRTAVVVLLLASHCQSADEDYVKTASNLRTMIQNKFSKNRNHAGNMAYHEAARNFIKSTFEDNELDVNMVSFATSDPQTMGYNVVGILPGKLADTEDDEYLIVGAHFDTTPTTPGVDNNGSGLSAMLEALRQLKAMSCTFENTVIFAAFDMKEKEEPTSACPSGLCGSKNFVEVWLKEQLESTGSKVKGIIILDTIMNYDTKNQSQEIFLDNDEFSSFNAEIRDADSKGDFLFGVGRKSDSKLMAAFRKAWNDLSKPEYKIKSIELDIEGAPSEDQMNAYPRLMDSDHKYFWTNDPSYSAIYLSDTDDKRGVMRQCYHSDCDNSTVMLTDSKLTFLAKSTIAVTNCISEMAVCSDPESSAATSAYVIQTVLMLFMFGLASFFFM